MEAIQEGSREGTCSRSSTATNEQVMFSLPEFEVENQKLGAS
jgi:hypothetical protein